jgi:hypothetical protein
MKEFILPKAHKFFLFFVVVLFALACANNKKGSTNTPPDPSKKIAPPAAPIAQLQEEKLVINWLPSKDAASYKISIVVTIGDQKFEKEDTSKTTSYEFSFADPKKAESHCTDYKVAVRAIGKKGEESQPVETSGTICVDVAKGPPPGKQVHDLNFKDIEGCLASDTKALVFDTGSTKRLFVKSSEPEPLEEISPTDLLTAEKIGDFALMKKTVAKNGDAILVFEGKSEDSSNGLMFYGNKESGEFKQVAGILKPIEADSDLKESCME